MSETTGFIVQEVLAERQRQDRLWAEQNHSPEIWSLILGEEVGECATAILEKNLPHLRVELIQVAAVALAFIASLDRNELNNTSYSDLAKTA